MLAKAELLKLLARIALANIARDAEPFEDDFIEFLRKALLPTISANTSTSRTDVLIQNTILFARRDQTTPSIAAGRKESAARLRDALARLSDRHKQVIQLRRFEELEIAEIAKVMERSENATRILYCRAVQALRAHMVE